MTLCVFIVPIVAVERVHTFTYHYSEHQGERGNLPHWQQWSWLLSSTCGYETHCTRTTIAECITLLRASAAVWKNACRTLCGVRNFVDEYLEDYVELYGMATYGQIW